VLKPEDITYYDEMPKNAVASLKGHGIDLAISQKEGADYTAIVSGDVFYVDNAPKIFIRPNPVGFARCSVCDRQSFARTTPSNRTTNRGSGENRCKREGRSSPGHFLSSGLLREYCEKPAFLAY
jgi:hypothetical protein